MDDLISRQAAIEAMSESLKRVFPEHRQIAEKCLNVLPSAQPEIIRCKECHHNRNCEIQYVAMAGDLFFCGRAERREDG